MNKQYMDFMPSQGKKTVKSQPKTIMPDKPVRKNVTQPKRVMAQKSTATKTATSKTIVSRPTVGVASRATVTRTAVPRATASATNVSGATKNDSFSIKNDVELGVVEELTPKFVKTDVPKRPLSAKSGDSKNELEAIKARKLTGTTGKTGGLAGKKKAEKVSTYQTPRAQFINKEKVVKRPLSKNVYQKKIEEPKPSDKGPVTIIAKPEKEAHVSLIVTIILTIILGAAAGTVAFLLLPK